MDAYVAFDDEFVKFRMEERHCIALRKTILNICKLFGLLNILYCVKNCLDFSSILDSGFEIVKKLPVLDFSYGGADPPVGSRFICWCLEQLRYLLWGSKYIYPLI